MRRWRSAPLDSLRMRASCGAMIIWSFFSRAWVPTARRPRGMKATALMQDRTRMLRP